MIIKSFVADSVAGALKMVRSELGGDAVILKTRKLDASRNSVVGGKVEVTACVDRTPGQPAVVPPKTGRESQTPLTVASYPADEITRKLDFLIDIFQAPVRKAAFPGGIGQVFMSLLHADIPETMASDLADRLSERFNADDEYDLIASTAARMLQDQLPKNRGPQVFKKGQRVALVGPAGSGKTSLIGRLAGCLVGDSKLPVCLTSLDRVKISAPEELLTYADILDVDHFEMPAQVDRSLLEDQGREKITLIDTPALNTRDREEIELYAEKLSRIKPHRVIGVFSATLRTSDMMDMTRAYKSLKLTELAMTMTDQTSHLGGMIGVSIQTGLPVTILGTGRKAGCIDLNPDHERIIGTFLGTGKVTKNG
jgi:flagellar biosynthesis protein FlhF